jgi:histone acetyltransferase (RNA polymerase elongator complex component)
MDNRILRHNRGKKTRPFVVPVFIPQSGCPHRCAFCNQHAVTGADARLPSLDTLQTDIRRFLGYRRENRTETEISFFGGNFLGQDHETIVTLLDAAAAFVRSGEAQGIRFSTRPDTIDNDRLALISGYPVKTVEIGAQSMDDKVLTLSRRGHSSLETVRAVHLLKQNGYKTWLQIMVGLPGENHASAMETGRQIASLSPDFVRIYPTLVIRDSLLERWYKSGAYEPLTLDGCIDLVKKLFLLFSEKNIPVIRVGLQANEGLDTGRDLVAGPYHPAMGQLVLSEIFFDKAVAAVDSPGITELTLFVNPRMISTMRGQKNTNISRLKTRFSHLGAIRVIPDPDLDELDVKVYRNRL